MRHYINIVEHGFMNPERSSGFHTSYRGTADPKVNAAIETARQYQTAEEYADAMNSISPMNTDPPHVRDNYEREQASLIDRWNRWQQLGMLG